MKRILENYWPLLEVSCALDPATRSKLFAKLSEKKDFRKMMKALMRHAKGSGKNIPIPKKFRNKIPLYDAAITKLAMPSNKVPLKKRKQCIRQVGGAFPFLIPILASLVGEFIASQV